MTSINTSVRRRLLVLATAAIAVSAPGFVDTFRTWVRGVPVAAQTLPVAPWTAVGASGIVDESAIASFVFVSASAGYRSATTSVSPLEFRYNIGNVLHDVRPSGIPSLTSPGWTILELGAQAPATSTVTAYLYRVNRCTGAQSLICWVQHTNRPVPGACRTCQFANSTFNFTTYLYYVRVIVDRNTTSELPMVHSLRIY